jgi:glycerol-3-phosphate O-acyltransferase 1/2
MKAEELCTLFDHEFTFNKPCVGIRSVLYDGLEALIAGGMMSYAQSQPMRPAYWDDEDDMGYSTDRLLKLHALADQLQKLSFFQSLLAPFVESYWMVAHCLSKLRDQPMTQTHFLSVVQDTIKQRLKDNLTCYAECCSLDPLSNAVKHFLVRGIIEKSEISSDYLLLNKTYASELSHLVSGIAQFRKA